MTCEDTSAKKFWEPSRAPGTKAPLDLRSTIPAPHGVWQRP